MPKDNKLVLKLPITKGKGEDLKANPDNVEIDIIYECARKSKKHQELLYKKFYGYVMAICMAYCSDRTIAQEVVDDTFIKVFESINSYDSNRPFKSWLRRIAVNCAIDELRRNKKHMNHLDITEYNGELPNVDLVDTLTVQDIHKMLSELPELLKVVFNLYEIEGYSHREIAKLLDIGESSSRTYLVRAKKQLRRLALKYLQ
ncbi:MAG: RNA polymerase sigma factor [Bacteroidota bacterium]